LPTSVGPIWRQRPPGRSTSTLYQRLHRYDDLGTGLDRPRHRRVDLRHAQLEVDASSVRGFEGRRAEAAPWSGRFLDHHLGAEALEVGEALSRPLEQDAELEHADVEAQRRGEIDDIQLGYQHRRILGALV